MLRLYYAPGTCALAPHIALEETGADYETERLNFKTEEQKKPDYLKINPTARIPTLIDPEGPGGKPLTVTQSWAILMYLCEKTGKFLPADPAARVRMFQWMAEGAADYASVNQTIFFLGARMPEIERFGGFKLLMFFQDENPPHVHIKGANFAAKIRISNGDLLAGDEPNRVLRRARQWIAIHQAELLELWDEFQR